ncbi:MAG: 1-acyl-sn-glycerol-3-phosphate acyltransferase [Hyphomicrobiales bacterium]|nr:1-acyl-sn-glycerol-3-phosphate acyltransferase [Hyphomicrobiales bacterium]
MIAMLRLIIVIPILLMLTVALAPVQLISRALNIRLAKKIPYWFHRILLCLIGVRVIVHGSFSSAHPLLLICNHISWLDIPVMGSIDELSFIAKTEVGNWPVISQLAKMQGTVFVNRQRGIDTANQADSIASRLLAGDVMVLFAEGTTGDGNRILPFKSSLLGAAQYAIRQSHIDKVAVQPVAISYSRLHGLPLGRRYQSETSWPGDVPLAKHAFNILIKSAFDVDVVLGDPMDFTASSNRKLVSRNASDQVATMYSNAMRSNL